MEETNLEALMFAYLIETQWLTEEEIINEWFWVRIVNSKDKEYFTIYRKNDKTNIFKQIDYSLIKLVQELTDYKNKQK